MRHSATLSAFPLYTLSMRHGFLLIRKPKGPTSHDMVGRVRTKLGERNIGHLGTLDPAAEGLLVLAVGAKALKVVELFMGLPKSYVARVRFGAVSSTYDSEGVIEHVAAKPGWKEPDLLQLRRTLEERFTGRIAQVPPAYSALKVGGVAAHRAARAGKDVQLAAREVDIHRCVIRDYAYPDVALDVDCGSGTYIRSLAHDLGQVLRCGGYLMGLERTRVGEWSVDDAVPPDEAAWTDVLPLKDVLDGFPRVDVTAEEAEHLRFGRSIPHEIHPDVIAWHDGLPIAILVPAKDGSRGARARKVF